MDRELRIIRSIGRLGDGRILYLFSDGSIRTADGVPVR